MASKNGGKSPIERAAAFIVDKRKAFYLHNSDNILSVFFKLG